MADLSPAAQAVLDAAEPLIAPSECLGLEAALAAALRAAVAQTQQRQYGDCWICDANELLDIADELEAVNG